MSSLPTKDLTGLLNKESTFRAKGMSLIATIARGRDVSNALRALAILFIALFVVFSVQFCALILELLFAFAHHPPGNVRFGLYAGLFGAEWVASMALAIPLLPKLDSLGEAKRLEEKMHEMRIKRASRTKIKRRNNE